eukprot:jgi/Chlat1/6635/Chrsp489S06117
MMIKIPAHDFLPLNKTFLQWPGAKKLQVVGSLVRCGGGGALVVVDGGGGNQASAPLEACALMGNSEVLLHGRWGISITDDALRPMLAPKPPSA